LVRCSSKRTGERAATGGDVRHLLDEVRYAAGRPVQARSLAQVLNYRIYILEMGWDLPARIQDSTLADSLFDPIDLIVYISTIITPNPGDGIATGTSGAVGHARTPAVTCSPGRRW